MHCHFSASGAQGQGVFRKESHVKWEIWGYRPGND